MRIAFLYSVAPVKSLYPVLGEMKNIIALLAICLHRGEFQVQHDISHVRSKYKREKMGRRLILK